NYITKELHNRLPKDDIFNLFIISHLFELDNDQISKRTYTTKTKRKLSCKCTNCGKFEYTRSSCPKLTKRIGKKRKTNYIKEDSSSSGSSEFSKSSEISKSDSDDMHVYYGLKKKLIKRRKKKIKLI